MCATAATRRNKLRLCRPKLAGHCRKLWVGRERWLLHRILCYCIILHRIVPYCIVLHGIWKDPETRNTRSTHSCGCKMIFPQINRWLELLQSQTIALLKKLGGRAFAPRNGRFLSTERGEEHPWVFLLPNKVVRCCRAAITCRKKDVNLWMYLLVGNSNSAFNLAND